MASLPTINRISREDLKEAPAWIDRLIYPLNLFFDSVYNALRNLTFVDNITSMKKSFSIKAGASATDNILTFPISMKKSAEMLFIGYVAVAESNYSPIGQPVFIEWIFDGENIQITSISGLTSGKTYNFRILVI